ncbi:kelch-like protein 22 [Anastrepha obliqua]|uniref:kelch-like protein 22 n=1 Tax=Anastrepha obliqua TaxID=95512 RepID=UPI0024090B91|nr:kelch-like protein 22 [Anastrepha obliqua]XP_054728399.1 kelch-like protein 22 [Anastrepha obliqua]XP_054728400.1 kelch-like protein 22 [Anastrepha obliqua]
MAGGAASISQGGPENRANPTCAVCASTAYSRNANNDNFMQIIHSEALMKGLNALRCAEKLFDVTLLVEGRTFKAHRVVLAACSDYFCAMFTDAMREAHQSEIKLNGINAHGLELLLEYVYTSKLELDRNNVQDVLSVSTHVQMKAAIDACSHFLESQIDLDNCVAIAALADLYSLEPLKKKAYRYMCSRLDEFAQTPDLLSLTLDQFEHVLACNYPVDCSEQRVLEIVFEYCLETDLKPELTRRLFGKVQFHQIGACAINAMKSKGNTSLESNINALTLAYYRVLNDEMLKQEMGKLRLADTYADDLLSAEVLTNTRGMELALVKIGGFETNGLTNRISCYLPSKGKWESLTVIPHIEQCNYGTAVLGNDLYVVGGSYDVCLKEYIHPFGFRYCPAKNKWKTIAPIQADRCRFSLNAMGNNFLYAVGGVCELNENDGGAELWAHDMAVSNCERYDANADRWEYLPALSENRSQHAGVVLGDQLYISGGIDRHIVLASLWRFDTKSSKWHKLCRMPTPRADHVLIVFDGHIYAFGGWYEDPVTEMRVLADAVDVYDTTTDQWTTESHNPLPKYYTGVAAVKRKVYFIGGLLSTATINRATSAVQCYDLDTKQWTFSSEWEYPKEVWESTCAAFYVPRERDNVKYYWDDA